MHKDEHQVPNIEKQSYKFEMVEFDSVQDKSIDKDLNQITQIQKFLERNYRDVNNLQSYLINELQTIENCKNRNKKVQKMIVSNIIPTFRDIKTQICNLKSIIPLLNNLATTYIETVYEKSVALLAEKQTQCRKYETQIEDLKRKVQEYKDKQKFASISTPQKINQVKSQVRNQKQSYSKKTAQKYQQENLGNEQELSFNKTQKSSSMFCPKNSTESQEVSIFKDNFNQEVPKPKTDDKLNKYQEVYQNILKSKKVNISYKCEKSPIKTVHESRSPSKSPYQAKTTTTNRQEQAFEDRKLYIKQKIEKIKLKAECKQYQRNVKYR